MDHASTRLQQALPDGGHQEASRCSQSARSVPIMPALQASSGATQTVLIVASAQLIRATAVSGWSPNSPATRAAQPRTPSPCSVAATARRTWLGEGDPEGCRADTNSAPARTASNVPGTSYPASDVFVAIIAVPSPVRLTDT